MDKRPIGVFDSGLGGLTAVSEIMRLLPGEDIVYLGDTARVPYGTRSEETITRYAREDVDFLLSYDTKAIIIACGTVSSVSLPKIEKDYDIPMFGVVKPAAAAAVRTTKNKKIGIIGTSATIRSRSYEREIVSLLPDAEIVAAPCPLFVPLVENGRTSPDDIVIMTMIREYISPLKDSGIDTLILGCTHYPIIEDAIRSFTGDLITLINPGLEAAKLLKTNDNIQKNTAECGRHRFFVSDDAEGFSKHASAFLGTSLRGDVEKVFVGK